MSYEKSKRKNEDVPSLPKAFLRGLWRYGAVLPAQGTWWLTKQTARGSWWLTKNGAQWGWDAAVWTTKAPMRLLTWMWYAIMGLPPEFETQRETNIYRLIRRRYRRRNFYMFHTMTYFIGMFISVWAITDIYRDAAGMPSGSYLYQQAITLIILSVVWTIVWAFHGLHKRSGDSEDRELRESLEREYERQQRAAEKPVYEEVYRERLALNEYEVSGNHTQAYYEDDSDYKPVRKR